MGFLQRHAAKYAEKSAERIWAEVLPLKHPLEMAVNHAHLRGQSAREDLRGTLFLTTHRVIWRIHEPGYPKGSGFEVNIDDLKALITERLTLNNEITDLLAETGWEATADGRVQCNVPGVFGIGMERNGQVGQIGFSPQRPGDPASIALADAMLQSIKDMRQARRGALE